MIYVLITKDSRKKRWQISLKGHADYAKRGEDIVCAGVSVLVQSIFNGLTEVLGYKLSYRMKDGYFSFQLPTSYLEHDERVKVMLDTLVLNLKDLEKTYKKHIKLMIEEVH
ncbi:MAG: ribosomal-processing cysteine protease Prp [Filifactor alocis]|nr:ribosomal-processing cysteine protease Prp [Filifactor alocis]